MAKLIAAEENRAGLRYAVVCPNVTGRTKKRIAQIKRTCTGSLAIVDSYKWRVVSSGLMSCCLSLALRLFWFCFVFVVYAINQRPGPFVQSFLDMHEPRQPHALT